MQEKLMVNKKTNNAFTHCWFTFFYNCRTDTLHTLPALHICTSDRYKPAPLGVKIAKIMFWI